jgi:hypothetical protein
MMLGHKLVYVVVVAVLDARADAPGPRGPLPIVDPALAEGGYLDAIGAKAVPEAEVLNVNSVRATGATLPTTNYSHPFSRPS